MPTFVNGLRVFKPNEKAPDFVKANLVINCKELVEFMRANHTDGQIRIDIKLAKTGNLYAELNTWKREKQDHPFGKGKTYQEAVCSTDRGTQDLSKSYPSSEGDIQTSSIPF